MPPTHYCLVVKGELGPRYASAFEEMTISTHDGITEITGEIIDSAHLNGLLGRISDLGLAVYSLTPLDTDEAASGTTEPTKSDRSPEARS